MDMDIPAEAVVEELQAIIGTLTLELAVTRAAKNQLAAELDAMHALEGHDAAVEGARWSAGVNRVEPPGFQPVQ